MTETPVIELRPATPPERPAIEAACRGTYKRDPASLPHAFHDRVFEHTYGQYIAACFTPKDGRDSKVDGMVQAAFLGGDLAGYVMLSQSQKPGGSLDSFDIHLFAPFRGQGVGRTLVDWCQGRAEGLEMQDLHATVRSLGDNRAAFFEAAGLSKLYELWRSGPDVPPRPPETAPEKSRYWGVLQEPNFLWLIIAMLSIAVLVT